MAQKYCLVGQNSGELLSYQGFVLTHENKRELEYLFPALKVVALPKAFGEEYTMRLQDHPDMDTVVFPLEQNMDQFKVRRIR